MSDDEVDFEVVEPASVISVARANGHPIINDHHLGVQGGGEVFVNADAAGE